MTTTDQLAATRQTSRVRFWISWVLSGLAILFMLMDSILKLVQPDFVVAETLSLGYAEYHILLIGILGLVCTLVYAFPRTAVLGAILLTGYFGGAIATHVRLDSPLFTHILFPVYLGLLVWGGLWLRNAVLRKLMPFRNGG